MASVGSVGFYAQLSAKNKGIGGLASGLDTDSLVEALTMATRTKLAKQNQIKTQLGWKTTAYRSVATTLRGFQGSYLSATAGTNSLAMQAFFNTYEGTATSDKITVSAGSGAIPGTFTVDAIKQLATNQTLKTKEFKSELSGEAVDLLSGSYANKTLQLQMGGAVKTIKLDTLDAHKSTALDFQTELQSLVDTAFGTKPATSGGGSYITANVTPELDASSAPTGKHILSFEGGTSTVTVRNNSDDLGLAQGQSNRLVTSKTIKDLFGGTGPNDLDTTGGDFTISINNVKISFSAEDSMNNVMSKISNSTAGVRVTFDPTSETFSFTSKVMGAGNNIDMRDVEGNFLNTLVGAEGGNSFAATMSYTDASQTGSAAFANLTTAAPDVLAKYKFNITVGGQTKTLSLDVSNYTDEIDDMSMTLEAAIETSLKDQINSAFGLGTGLSFDIVTDASGNGTFSLVSAKNGQEVYLSKYESVNTEDAFTKLGFNGYKNTSFKVGYSSSFAGGEIADPSNDSTLDTLISTTMSGNTYTMKMTIGGETKDVSIEIDPNDLAIVNNAAGDKATNQRKYLAQLLNAAKNKAFSSSPDVEKVSFEIGLDNKINVKTSDSDIYVELGEDTTATNNLYTTLQFGAAGTTASNYKPGSGTKLAEFADVDNGDQISITVGDPSVATNKHEFTLDNTMTIADLIDDVNSYFGKTVMGFDNGKVTISGGNDALAFEETPGSTSDVFTKLFNRSTYTTAAAASDFQDRLDDGMGLNAEIVVNGQTLYEASNTFNVNGTNFTVNALHNENFDPAVPASPKPDPAIGITVTSNPDDVVDKLKGFIEEYNSLVDILDGVVKEKTVEGYEPLTDEQRADMTEDQIKQWENEAKKGLLYNDSTIRGIMQQMRTALYTSVEAAGISLYEIGITTESFSSSATYKGNGRLEMTEAGEKKLREALTNNPDAVRTLFTDPDEGLAKKLDTIISDAIRTSSTDQGSLVALAGHADSVINSYSIGRRVEDLDEQIARLQTRLENEYNRYWQKFANLETAISNMNNQSSYLSNMSSGG